MKDITLIEKRLEEHIDRIRSLEGIGKPIGELIEDKLPLFCSISCANAFLGSENEKKGSD